jgi:hypothetical protein
VPPEFYQRVRSRERISLATHVLIKLSSTLRSLVPTSDPQTAQFKALFFICIRLFWLFESYPPVDRTEIESVVLCSFGKIRIKCASVRLEISKIDCETQSSVEGSDVKVVDDVSKSVIHFGLFCVLTL